jgi:hypothetical protein
MTGDHNDGKTRDRQSLFAAAGSTTAGDGAEKNATPRFGAGQQTRTYL